MKFYQLSRFIRRIRNQRSLGIILLLVIVATSIVGNTLTFFFFERLADEKINFFDSLWYSIVSITTIGYGDLSPVSIGARLGTIFFIIVIGLTTFTAAAGIMVDWILEFQYKERAGMGNIEAKNHLLIVNYPNEARVRQIVEEFRQDAQHRKEDIVIVSDLIQTIPPTLPDVMFVRGSPLEEESYRRAKISQTRQAIVLSTGYDDPNSDSMVASIVSIIEHLNPQVNIVAECLDEKHEVLFSAAKHVSLVHTLRLANNLLVQEAQDPGVNLLTQAVTSNQIDGTLASTKVEDDGHRSPVYLELAKKLLDVDINLIGVIRDGVVHFNFGNLALTKDDSLVYISSNRHTWQSLRSLLE